MSSLLWLEYARVIRRPSFRDSLPPGVREQFALARWNDLLVRENYQQALMRLLDTFIEQFDTREIAFGPTVRAAAVRLLGVYDHLKPLDVAHLASATSAGVWDLASFDADFRHVDGLQLWNDRIFAG